MILINGFLKELVRVMILINGFLLLQPPSTVKVYSYSRTDFPSHFIFGSGSSAYQVEGAAFEDGRTPSIWDTYAHAGHVDGYTGDIACDQYHKYKEDVQLMVDTGLDAYRFSISWSRLIPNGKGPVNLKAVEYYNNLLNELNFHGIQPHVVLLHMDIPQALEDNMEDGLSNRLWKTSQHMLMCASESLVIEFCIGQHTMNPICLLNMVMIMD